MICGLTRLVINKSEIDSQEGLLNKNFNGNEFSYSKLSMLNSFLILMVLIQISIR
jgi:hypothetical protein